MFPLRDDIPSERVPFVNFTLIGLCIGVFLLQLAAPDQQRFVSEYGMIPVRVVRNESGPLVAALPTPVRMRNGEVQIVQEKQELPPLPIPPWLTMITCMFLHGGLMHLVGNMWFLLIFGDNVEDRFGHVPYLLIYLLSGLAAGLLQIAFEPSSAIPTVGASGAIAGVMGAYFILFPHARVVALIPLILIWPTVVLPAPIFLGLWFLFQLGSAALSPGGMGGVAWWAHVGGFAAGIGLAWWGRQSGWLHPVRTRNFNQY